MKQEKQRKQQEDRLLKHFTMKERRQQVQLRKMIAADPSFSQA